MKKHASILITGLAICLVLAQSGWSANLILNGTFEDGDTGSPDYFPLNWSMISSTGQLELVIPPANGNASANCLRLTNSNDSTGYDENLNGMVNYGDFGNHYSNTTSVNGEWFVGFISAWLSEGVPGIYQESVTTYQADTLYHFDADTFYFDPNNNVTTLRMDMGYLSDDNTFIAMATKSLEVENYSDGFWQTKILGYRTPTSGLPVGKQIAVRFTKVDPVPSLSGLQLHWRFDETTGSTAYDSAETAPLMDGVVSGASWDAGGQVNGCLSFDGSGDDVALDPGTFSSLEPGDTTWTFELWIWVAAGDTNNFYGIANKGNVGSTDPGWMLYMAGGIIYFRVHDTASGSNAITAAVPSDAQWHKITCVVDRSINMLRGAIDDNYSAFTSTSIVSVGTIEAFNEFQVGSRAGGPYFKGKIDEVKVTTGDTANPFESSDLYVDNLQVSTPLSSFITGPHGATITNNPGAPDFSIVGTGAAHHFDWDTTYAAGDYGATTPTPMTDGGRIYMDYGVTDGDPAMPDHRVACSVDNGRSFTDLVIHSGINAGVNGLCTVWYGKSFGQEKIFRRHFEPTPPWFYADDANPIDPVWTDYSKDFSFKGEPPTFCINTPFAETLFSVCEKYTLTEGAVTDSSLSTFFSYDGGTSWEDGVDLPDPYNESNTLFRLPTAIVSPDGAQVIVLAGLDGRGYPYNVYSDMRLARMWLSSDSSCNFWEDPQKAAGELGGDRFFVGYTKDYGTTGRLVIQFRNILAPYPSDDNRFDATAWVGTFDDIGYGRPGQYRVRIADKAGDWYGGMTVVPPEDEFGENEYLIYHNNVCSHFKLSDFDPAYFAMLKSDLLLRLKFEETSGTHVSDSAQCSKWGPNPYGTKTGGTWSTDGHFSRCLYFDGIDDYVNFESYNWTGLDPEDNGWSLSFWYKTPDRTQAEYVLSKGNANAADGGYSVYMDSSEIHLRVGDGSNSATLSTPMIDNSSWHHVVLVVNRALNTLTGYYDNTSTGFGSTGISSLSSIESSDHLLLGCKPGPADFVEVYLDDVRVYDKALSSSDVSTLFNE